MKRYHILSLFAEYFSGPFNVSMLKRAQENGLLSIEHVDLRNFGEGKHRKVDDRPYGGGPGMVLMPGPTCQAIRSVKEPGSYVVHLSPQGKVLTAEVGRRLATHSHLILLCGHYEGVDERVLEKEVDEEISIGDYVLTNGCIAAIVLIDVISRFIPGVIGNEEAAANDSFEAGIFDAPHYTRPPEFEGSAVPDVLQNGNHAEISKWRKAQACIKTRRVRPDLLGGEGEKK